jgi:predicted dehydrogenase
MQKNRRNFVANTVGTLAAFSIVPRHVCSGAGEPAPSARLNIACIGIGGQGGGVTRDLAAIPHVNIVALCDVQRAHEARMAKEYPGRPFFQDYRKMLESVKGIDAVMIATPDHWHAPIALAALRSGLHVYCEKPLTHTIEEARLLKQVAAETKLVTQMGNSGHAGEGLRQTKEWIDAGVIGNVTEVHTWSDRPGKFWQTQGKPAPTDSQPVPDTLDWDLWLGPAADRPFHSSYAPRQWRGFYDFGCGALGDMMVHNADPAWYALGLGQPTSVEAEMGPTNRDTFPEWCIVKWHFAATDNHGPITVTWYDGGKKPPLPPGAEADMKLDDNGIYFVGTKGSMLGGGWSAAPRLVPDSMMKDFQPPKPTIARSVGHRLEWVDACIAGKPEDAKAGFWYSAPFTESLLVGVLPIRLGKRIEWDAAAMRATNAPEADEIIRKSYRAGYGLG